MTERDAKAQAERLNKYRALDALRTKTHEALRKVTEDWKSGPCGQGPFTGNTRESRCVEVIHFKFTRTRGGAPPVELIVGDLGVEAYELGQKLQSMLKAKLEQINSEIAKL